MKIFIAVAGLVVVLALVSQGGALNDDADAQVDIVFTDKVDISSAREQIVAEASSSWQATRVAESSESADESTVRFSLPGSSMDGFITSLRREADTRSVDVQLEVDPEQLQPDSLATAPEGDGAAAPVEVQVNLTRDKGQGPLVTFIGGLLVAVLAALALGMVWRRFNTEADPEPPTLDDPPRRWTNRT